MACLLLAACGEGAPDELARPPELETANLATPAPLGECQTAAECRGALPHYCDVCGDGGSSCAHWSCVQGRCQIATCD
ncbi:MAG: hypothetical protein ACYCWW_01085 [Deltaproteobacteria bacterium]